MKLIAGSRSPSLAKSLANRLKIPFVSREMKQFADGEIYVKINESVTGEDVYIIQSLAPFVNESLVELLILSQALKRKVTGKITAVIPYFAYARQDKNLSFLMILLKASGIDHVLTLDLHKPNNQKILSLDVLTTTFLFAGDIQNRFNNNSLVVVSPDAGGKERAQSLSEKLNTDFIVLSKIRRPSGDVFMQKIETNLQGRTCLIVDDIVDSGVTLWAAASVLKEAGAKEIHAYVTHAILSDSALDKIKQSQIDSLTTTDSIYHPTNQHGFRILSIIDLLVDALEARYSN